jgi:hypothetical protein
MRKGEAMRRKVNRAGKLCGVLMTASLCYLRSQRRGDYLYGGEGARKLEKIAQ